MVIEYVCLVVGMVGVLLIEFEVELLYLVIVMMEE